MDFLTAEALELIDGQYAGRQRLRPVLDAVLAVLPGIDEVSVQARKTCVPLVSPRHPQEVDGEVTGWLRQAYQESIGRGAGGHRHSSRGQPGVAVRRQHGQPDPAAPLPLVALGWTSAEILALFAVRATYRYRR